MEEAKRKRKFFNKTDRTLPTKWVGSTFEGEGGQLHLLTTKLNIIQGKNSAISTT